MKKFPVPGEDGFDSLLEKLSQALRSSGWNLATAESCTGGWIAKCCTDLAGSSDWFERGLVSYSNAAKHELLGVDRKLIEADGAVSRAVAEAMAEGARRRAGAEVALAVTGIAGPEGGGRDKPVGTVWFAWSLPGEAVRAECVHFDGNRDAVRRQAVGYALQALLERLVP